MARSETRTFLDQLVSPSQTPTGSICKEKVKLCLSHSSRPVRFLSIGRKVKTMLSTNKTFHCRALFFFPYVKISLTSDNTAAMGSPMLISLATAGLLVFQVLILRFLRAASSSCLLISSLKVTKREAE